MRSERSARLGAVTLGVLLATMGGTSSANSAPTREGSFARGIAERSAAPVRFERDGDRLRTTLTRAALDDAFRDLADDEGPLDLRAFGDLARAAILAATGEQVAPRPAIEDAAEAPIHLAFGAGDLTGDGNADVFDLELTEQTLSLVARGGTDGAEAWRIPITGSDLLVLPVADTNGDGRDDVAILELLVERDASQGACAPLAACFAVDAQTFRWELTMRSGLDGTATWMHTSPGVVLVPQAGGSTDTTYAVAAAITATNALVVPLISGDHDGDGAPDLVLDELDLVSPLAYASAYTEQLSPSVLAVDVLTTTRASVRSGADGSTLFARASAGPGASFLEPVPDLAGDPTTDLLWDANLAAQPVSACAWGVLAPDGVCAAPGLQRRTIELLDGSTFASVWTSELPGGAGWVLPAGGDLDADGSADLLFLGGVEGLSSTLIRGNDGTLGWSVPEIVLGAAGMLDGVPIVVSAQIAEPVSSIEFEIRRRDGRDATLVSATPHHIDVPTDWWEIFIIGELWLLPDADDDGDADVLAQVTVEARDITHHLWVERGKEPVTILQRGGPDAPYAVTIGDADGDGNDDLLDIHEVGHRESFDLTFSGVSLPSGMTTWTVQRRIHRETFVFLERAGDLTGAGGSDVLLSWIYLPFDAPLEAMIEPIETSDGSVPWQVGTSMSQPPLPEQGGIAGTITGDGATFFGACAILADTDGNEIDMTLARGDGSYELAELGDGEYLVRFADCFFGSYRDEWFEDAPDPASATVISIVGGVQIDGIDADLAAW